MIFMGSMLAGAVEGTVVDHASFEAVFSIQFSCNFLAMVWVFLFVKNPSSPTVSLFPINVLNDRGWSYFDYTDRLDALSVFHHSIMRVHLKL